MRFVLACGGSGGHINPALSVAQLLRREGHEVLFIGAPQGLERDLVPREGFPIEFVEVHALSHSITPKAFFHNVGVAQGLVGALRKAKKILSRFDPHAALGMGGYASYPPLRAAMKLGIPVLVHESNAIPGVTTRLLAKGACKILVGMEACRKAYSQQDHVEVVGTPVKPEFFTAERMQARESLRLDNRPLLVSFFGSQGARDMNTMMLELMHLEQKDCPWQHIHVTGAKAYPDMTERAAKAGLRLEDGLRMEEYLYNMPEVMAAADLIVCRAGASTLAELAAARCPSVLIPSAHVANDHQTANARAFAGKGGAVMKTEGELSAEILYDLTAKLLQNTKELDKMKGTLEKCAIKDSVRLIVDLLLDSAKD